MAEDGVSASAAVQSQGKPQVRNCVCYVLAELEQKLLAPKFISGVQIAVLFADRNSHHVRFGQCEISTSNSQQGSAGASHAEMGTRHDC